MIEVLVIIAVIVLLATILLPGVRNANAKAHRIRCVNNLKQIGLSFRIFATDHTNLFPAQISTNYGGAKELAAVGDVARVFQSMSNELSTPAILACPADNRRPAVSFATLALSNVSYFVGLESDATYPQMLLAGDRNLTVNGVPVNPGVLALTTNTVLGWSTEMHAGAGNVALGDGSVQGMTTVRLRQHTQSMAGVTNRLLIP